MFGEHSPGDKYLGEVREMVAAAGVEHIRAGGADEGAAFLRPVSLAALQEMPVGAGPTLVPFGAAADGTEVDVYCLQCRK